MSDATVLQHPATAQQTSATGRSKIQTRRPQLSGQFYPSPIELRLYGNRLGLDFADRAVIEAIDAFPDGWDVTREAIARAADCSVARVKRTLSKLDDKLIKRKRRFYNGHICGAVYDLTPLWDKLAEIAKSDGSTTTAAHSETQTAARIETQTAAHSEPPPVDVQSKETSRSGGSGADVARAREASHEKTTTTNQRLKIGELADERGVEAWEVETFAEADREIKRLLALPRAKQVSCADCGEAFTRRPDDDETRCPPCAEEEAEDQRQRMERSRRKWDLIYEQQREQRARRERMALLDEIPWDDEP